MPKFTEWIHKVLSINKKNKQKSTEADQNKISNENSNLTIQPFPAKTNDPNDLINNPNLNQDLSSSAQSSDPNPPTFEEGAAQMSNSNIDDPKLTIQPFPATTNDPKDLINNPNLNEDLSSSAQLTDTNPPVFGQPGIQILNNDQVPRQEDVSSSAQLTDGHQPVFAQPGIQITNNDQLGKPEDVSSSAQLTAGNPPVFAQPGIQILTNDQVSNLEKPTDTTTTKP
ncbi:hypothetical protein DFH28DRAFT_354798 [Melampsora americana]|nr:hypothetical protein DFH28DRAFT_354798 [Melampsora americana]